MKVYLKIILIYSCLLCIASLFSCMTVPKESEIPEDTSPRDLSRKAQEACDINNYKAAHAYYEIILKRFPNDKGVCIAAKYEIAHLLVKQKQWKKAYEFLEKIIFQYEGADGMYLPPQYYKLAKIDHTRVKEKLGIK